MSNKKQQIPVIRFNGFTDAWEQRKLDDISEKVTEKNKNREVTETLTNSAEYGIISQSDFFDKDISNINNIDGYYVVRPDDFVYNPRISNFAQVGPIKRNNLNKIGVMSPLYYVFRIKNIDPSFLEKYFDTTYWHMFMKLNGDSGARADRFAIKDSVFKQMPIPYPSIEEQVRIGDFLKKMDNTIALHQRQLDNYKELKKAMMQKIFNQELRFKDEEGKPFSNWKKSTLGRLLTIERGGSPRPIYNYITTEENGINWIKIGDVSVEKNIITSTKEKIKPEGLKKTRRVYKGDLILSNSMSYGRPYILEIDGAIHDGWLLLRDEEGNFDKNYLCFMLSSDTVMKQYKMLAAGGVVDNLNSQLVKSVKVNVPAISEQQKIAEFLTALDQRTEKVAKRIESMKKQKKGLMQQMFI